MPEAAGFLVAASTPDGLITLLVFAASLFLFISGWLAPELTGLLAVALLVSFGVLDPQQAVKGFGSPALITLMGLFALSSGLFRSCLLYTSPSPRDKRQSRMPSSA